MGFRERGGNIDTAKESCIRIKTGIHSPTSTLVARIQGDYRGYVGFG